MRTIEFEMNGRVFSAEFPDTYRMLYGPFSRERVKTQYGGIGLADSARALRLLNASGKLAACWLGVSWVRDVAVRVRWCLRDDGQRGDGPACCVAP